MTHTRGDDRAGIGLTRCESILVWVNMLKNCAVVVMKG